MVNEEDKLCALALVMIGAISIIGGDATFFVWTLMIGVPLFFSKKERGGSYNGRFKKTNGYTRGGRKTICKCS